MQRIKTFLSDGTNPNGRLFATDLNAIQDAAAALTDLTQHLSVADVAIGESGLLLSRYGTGQAQLAGILRLTGGLGLPNVTTTQRDAFPAGKRPTGMVVYNTTTGQLEINLGSDATPNWQGASSAKSGDIKLAAYSGVPSGWLPCDGAAVSRSTYASLFAAIGVSYGAGDGSTTFNVPDGLGRMPVILGTHADVNALGKNEGVAVGSRRPRHKHTVNIPSGSQFGSNFQGASAGSAAQPNNPGGVPTVGPQTGAEPTDSAAYIVFNAFIKQ